MLQSDVSTVEAVEEAIEIIRCVMHDRLPSPGPNSKEKPGGESLYDCSIALISLEKLKDSLEKDFARFA